MSDVKITPKQYNKLNIATQFGEYLYQRLPKVYRDYDVKIERLNPNTNEVETFKTLEEYLKSFALGGFQPLLEDLEAIINLVDPLKCPLQFLPYLLQHFGLDYIDDIPEKFQRRLVQNIVTLYKKKGTIPAVAFLARELSGFGVTIEEKSDGTVEFALVKLDAYEDEDAELLLAQGVIQRYIHLFLPARSKSKIIVVYGFTENIHINAPDKAKEDDFDHAYYNVDEFVDSIVIDENGYSDTDGGYKEAFDYLNHVVEADFEKIKLRLEEETHNFQPSLVDLTSLTNNIENDGLPVFTNGISCEDTIKTGKALLSHNSSIQLHNTGVATIDRMTAKPSTAPEYLRFSVAKITSDLHKGDVLKIVNAYNNIYGYLQLDCDLYASKFYPTTIQFDTLNYSVRIYNQYYTEIIDGSYNFEKYTGYGRFFTTLRNGCSNFSEEQAFSNSKPVGLRISCDYSTDIVVAKSAMSTNAGVINCVFNGSQFFISHLGGTGFKTVDDVKNFVTKYPITLIAPASPKSLCDVSSGYTVAFKFLHSDFPSSVNETDIKTITCEVLTREDRQSIFSQGTHSSAVQNIAECNVLALRNRTTGDISLYDIGVPLKSYGGYNESLERHGDKYYLRSAIKQLDLRYIYDHCNTGGIAAPGVDPRMWFIDDDNSWSGIFNMFITTASAPSNIENATTHKYYLNYRDAWDFFSVTLSNRSSFTNNFMAFSGKQMERMTYEQYEHLWNEVFKYSDVPPKIYVYDESGVFGGETLTEITDPDVINKLNLLPIPEDCVIINSRGTDFAQIELSINSKLYY